MTTSEAAAAAPLVESRINAQAAADVPLTPAEASEMKNHLQFLFKNRQVLRLKVNATEDLLLNGAREPSHRGACLHLLSKVDLSCVSSTLTRIADPKGRTALLAGIVRFSSDVGVLLLYLESLTEAGAQREAAAAFAAAVRRLDFAGLSDARMRRVLELITTTFEGHERVQVLFGLLQSATFRTAFDRASGVLPEGLAAVFVPLRAVHDVIIEGHENRHGLAALTRGVEMLLDAPPEALRSHALPIRERLLESAVRLVPDAALADRAEDVLLDSLPREERNFSRLGILRAGDLLRRHEDERAGKLLALIREAHPAFHQPARWLEALEAPRIGRMAWIGWASEGTRSDASRRRGSPAASGSDAPRLRRVFWLDGQRPLWMRVGRPEDAPRLAAEVQIQREFAVGGIAPIVAHGVTEDGVPWAAMAPIGRPADEALARWRPTRPQAMAIALGAAQALLGLAALGVEIPDADPARFLVEDAALPVVMLADFSHARRTEPAPALRAHRAHAASLLELAWSPLRAEDVAQGLRARVAAAAGLPELIELLAREL